MANTVDKVIKIALNEVGYIEKRSDANLYDKTANAGSKNYTKYGKEMHALYPSVMDFPAAWCDAFVDWCFQKAYGVSNAKGLIGGDFNDYTPSSANLYKKKNAWHTSNPKIGDQIFFKNSKRICHTGLVYDVDGTNVYTVEGNTSTAAGVISNGGAVCKKKYTLSNSSIAGYGRPKYDDVQETTSPSTPAARNYLMKGDKGAEVKLMQENLIYIGYSCGKSGADGDFGGDTNTALKKFQKDHNLEVDGKYGVKSKAKLESLVASKKSAQASVNKGNSIVKAGQQHAINFTGVKIGVDGIVGAETNKMKARVLQHAMNLDYGNTITEDGIFGTKSKKKLGSHYVKKGESQYMVTAAEILMMLHGIDPNGVECPGKYGSGLVKAAKQFFGDDGTKITAAEFLKLIA